MLICPSTGRLWQCVCVAIQRLGWTDKVDWNTFTHEQNILFWPFLVLFCCLWLPKRNIKSYSTWFSTVEAHRRSDVGCERSIFFVCLRVLVLESFMASGQLVEQLLIERVALLTTACWHENVASNELMNDFAVSGHTTKGNVDVAVELYGHLEETEAQTKSTWDSFKAKTFSKKTLYRLP